MALSRLSLRVIAVLVPAVAVAAAAVAWRLAGLYVDTVVVAPGRIAQTVVVSGRVLAPAKVEVGSTITGRAERVGGRRGRARRRRPGPGRARARRARGRPRPGERGRARRRRRASSSGARSPRPARASSSPRPRRTSAWPIARRAASRSCTPRVSSARRAWTRCGARRRSPRASSSSRARAPPRAAEQGVDRRLLEDQLAQARAAREAAAAKLAQTRIVAPAPGVVLDRNVEPGDIVQPGRSLFTLALDGPARLTALIDEKNLGVLATGQRAIASADAFPDRRFDAVLAYLAPGIDVQRGTVEAKFDVAAAPALPARRHDRVHRHRRRRSRQRAHGARRGGARRVLALPVGAGRRRRARAAARRPARRARARTWSRWRKGSRRASASS